MAKDRACPGIRHNGVFPRAPLSNAAKNHLHSEVLLNRARFTHNEAQNIVIFVDHRYATFQHTGHTNGLQHRLAGCDDGGVDTSALYDLPHFPGDVIKEGFQSEDDDCQEKHAS